MASPSALPWSPITDLPSEWANLARTELQALGQVWSEQRGRLEQTGDLDIFTEKLAREFAIETGILERLYTLDRGITVLLIQHGIDASLIPGDKTDKDPALVAAIIQDQHEAAQALFDFVGKQRALSTAYVKELHALLTRHQATTTALSHDGKLREVKLVRGDWKKWPNNPQRANGTVHEYCPPEQVASEMDRLVQLHHQHQEAGIPPEVEAAWLHHRFTQIHPFQDGNGRVARCLASLVLLRARWFPLVVDRDQRVRYISVLEQADHGDLSPLADFVASAQKKALVGALSLVRETQRQAHVSQVIRAARRDLEQRLEQIKRGWEEVKRIAEAVQAEARSRLDVVHQQLEEELRPLRPDLHFFVDAESSNGERDYWFHYQVVETAKALGYFANTDQFHGWVRLVLKTDVQSEILVSLHGLGKEYTGLLAICSCFFQRGADEESAGQIVNLVPLAEEVCQLNYAEPQEQAIERFMSWLDTCLVKGLDLWRRGL